MNPPSKSFARSRQRDVAARVTSAMEATTPTTLVMRLACPGHASKSSFTLVPGIHIRSFKTDLHFLSSHFDYCFFQTFFIQTLQNLPEFAFSRFSFN